MPYFILLAWLALATGLVYAWRGPLLAIWREPVFTAPILIVESDDWGAGPATQADALAAIQDCLQRHHDVTGQPAVMTLALILATSKPGLRSFTTLLPPVLDALHAGQASGVFALQLHGMLHFWPETLRAAAQTRAEVRAWLDAPEFTEHLPSALQSRWIDASTLPSRPHAIETIEAAVTEEVAAFHTLLGEAVGAASAAISTVEAASAAIPTVGAASAAIPTPLVVVPPTFIWDARVEAAWGMQGVNVIITPGCRFSERDARGRPTGQGKPIRNGERGEGDVLYLVRDDYFEPMLGHTPEQALAALTHKTELGRPCLLETHRSNFLEATAGDLNLAVAALDELYRLALGAFPTLRFASSARLAQAIEARDAAWIEQDFSRRFRVWLHRAAALPRFGRAARLSGLMPVLHLLAPCLK